MLVLVVSLELLVVAHLERSKVVGLVVGLVLVEVDQELLRMVEVVALAGQVVVGYCMELEVVELLAAVELVG
jgi:hypothetical protein